MERHVLEHLGSVLQHTSDLASWVLCDTTHRGVAGGEILDTEVAAGRPGGGRGTSVLRFRLLFDTNVLIDTLQAVAANCNAKCELI